jgi:hypothetical protein
MAARIVFMGPRRAADPRLPISHPTPPSAGESNLTACVCVVLVLVWWLRQKAWLVCCAAECCVLAGDHTHKAINQYGDVMDHERGRQKANKDDDGDDTAGGKGRQQSAAAATTTAHAPDGTQTPPPATLQSRILLWNRSQGRGWQITKNRVVRGRYSMGEVVDSIAQASQHV